MIPRRVFLKRAGVGLGFAAAIGGQGVLATRSMAQDAPGRKTLTFRLGMAGYTFHKFKLDETLKMLKQVDVRYLCIKDFHLPLNSTDEQIAEFHAKCKDHNVTGYGVGPIYMGSEDEVDKAFEYAKRVGVKTLVGVPFKMGEQKSGASSEARKVRVESPELLKLVNKRVQEYDIKYAIHNHGPDMPELFPSAESAIELIKDMDTRVGLCLDIGHEIRDGKDPIKALKQFAPRVHDIHIKNVTAANKSGHGIEMPRGIIDMPAFVRALKEVRYSGVCSLEYEKDAAAPLTGVAESIGYFRGLMDSVA